MSRLKSLDVMIGSAKYKAPYLEMMSQSTFTAGRFEHADRPAASASLHEKSGQDQGHCARVKAERLEQRPPPSLFSKHGLATGLVCRTNPTALAQVRDNVFSSNCNVSVATGSTDTHCFSINVRSKIAENQAVLCIVPDKGWCFRRYMTPEVSVLHAGRRGDLLDRQQGQGRSSQRDSYRKTVTV
jgi:hypothetical protein